MLEASADDRLISGFDHARTGEQVLAAELGVAHARGVVLKVVGRRLTGAKGAAITGLAASPDGKTLYYVSSGRFRPQ